MKRFSTFFQSFDKLRPSLAAKLAREVGIHLFIRDRAAEICEAQSMVHHCALMAAEGGIHFCNGFIQHMEEEILALFWLCTSEVLTSKMMIHCHTWLI